MVTLIELSNDNIDFCQKRLYIFYYFQIMKQDILRRLFTLHISMDEIQPLIWRRLLTDSSTTLFELHNYLQLIFTNWRNYHLYLFNMGGVEFGDPRLWTEEDMIDVKAIRIHNLLKEEGQTLGYLYDPGDNWRMTILLESIDFDRDGNYRRPVCMDGENSAPPEDVGGIDGFKEFKEVIVDPGHPEYRHYRDWAGRSYDPLKFDLKKANLKLGKRKRYIFEYNLGIDVPQYTPRLI